MSKGRGGKQPLVRPGCYYTPGSCFRVKQHVVLQEGDDPPVSRCSGRLLPGEAPPPHVGQPKGLHQALFERRKVEGVLTPGSKKKPSNRSERTEAAFHCLEENGGQVTGIDPDTGKDKGASAWPDACGSAVEDPNCGVGARLP
jgi:hypothetical protein